MKVEMMTNIICKLLTTFTLSLVAVTLISCANKNINKVATPITAEQLFKQGEIFLAEKKFQEAADKFSLIYNEHPYAKEAIKSKVLEASAYYEKTRF